MNIHQLKQYIQNNLWHGENGRKPQPVTPELLASVLAPPTGRVWGIDISHWNLPPVDLRRMKDEFGMSFVIIKSNDGALLTRYAVQHIQAAKDAGLPFGIYVWLYPNNRVSIDAQVAAWAKSYNDYNPPLGVFIDAEWTLWGGQSANPSASDLRQAHDKLKALTGRSATTYTAAGYANTYLVGFDWTREPLWIANYNVTTPMLPKGVTSYKWWQYTSQLDGATLDPNGNKSLDGNYYNGTAAEFAAEYLGGTVPPTGGTMLYQTKVTLWFRSQPVATEATKIVAMPVGSKVWGEVGADGWVKATHLQLAGEQYAKAQAGYCFYSLDYLTVLQYVAPVLAPPPVVDDEIEIIVNGETKYHITGKLQ